MPRKRLGKVNATVNGWAVELAIDQQTIQRKLTQAGTPPVGGVLYDARTIFNAIHGDKERLLNEKRQEEVNEIKRKNLEAEKVLVNIEEAEKRIWNEVLMPVKVELDLAADKLSALVNPQSPELAHQLITSWSEEVKKQIGGKKHDDKEKKSKVA